jgi:hypothetical protein
MAWSDRQLLLASQSYLTDRVTTTKRLEQILPIYKELAQGAENSQLQDRARYGLAQVLEMQGKVDEAREAYGRVKGDLSALAAARDEQLASAEVKAACDWLATAELPKRETPSTGVGSALDLKPDFSADVPAPMPSSSPVTDTRSLEEIIGGETSPLGENRYEAAEGTDGKDTEATETDPVGAETETPTEETAPADEADKPASE